VRDAEHHRPGDRNILESDTDTDSHEDEHGGLSIVISMTQE
jgi:hypothetical protein